MARQEYDLLEKARRSIIKEIRASKRFSNVRQTIAPEFLKTFDKTLTRGMKVSVDELIKGLEFFRSVSKGFEKATKIPRARKSKSVEAQVSIPSITKEESAAFEANWQGPKTPEGWDAAEAIRKREGASAYEADIRSPFEQRLSELTDKYGGGSVGKDRAYDVLFKNLPFLKPIAKSLPSLAEPLSTIAAHPYASMMAGVATVSALNSQSVSAAKSVSNKIVEAAAYGSPGVELMDLAIDAGAKDSIFQRRAEMMKKFGSADYGYKLIGNALKGKDDFSRKAIMDMFGIDATDAFIAMRMATPKDERKLSPALRKQRVAEIVELETEFGLSGVGSVGDFAQALLNKVFGFARQWDYNIWERTREAMDEKVPELLNKIEDAARRANESSSLPSQSTTQSSEGVAPAGNQVSFSIGNVNVDADNPAEFIASMQEVASSRGGRSLAIAFDTGVMA